MVEILKKEVGSTLNLNVINGNSPHNWSETSKHSNSRQLKILVEFMESHPGLAKNTILREIDGKRKKNNLWKELVDKLNSNGPPLKSLQAWKKVWTDFKYNSKKKLVSNKRSLNKTGGGPPELTYISPLEEGAIAAAGLEASTSGLNVKTFGASSGTTEVVEDEIENAINIILESPERTESGEQIKSEEHIDTRIITGDSNISRTCPRASLSASTSELIKQELEEQKNFHCQMTELLTERNKLLKETNDILKERNEIEKHKYNLLSEQRKDNLEYRRHKIELRMEKIDLLRQNN